MDRTYFELVEDRSLSRSGFEVAINVVRYTAARDGEISLVAGCATIGELQSQINAMIDELHSILSEADHRFGNGPYGGQSLSLE